MIKLIFQKSIIILMIIIAIMIFRKVVKPSDKQELFNNRISSFNANEISKIFFAIDFDKKGLGDKLGDPICIIDNEKSITEIVNILKYSKVYETTPNNITSSIFMVFVDNSGNTIQKNKLFLRKRDSKKEVYIKYFEPRQKTKSIEFYNIIIELSLIDYFE